MSADTQCPWPGLIPYEEEDRDFFSGRDSEITALISVIRRAPLSVLFGQSGLGKTSLIQAGLFPRLREDRGFPVWVRLSFDPKAPPLTEQVLKKIREAAENTRQLYPDRPELHVTPPMFAGPAASQQTLWEYFHQREGYFWDARNHLVTPVIVLDQFEEWFTKSTHLLPDKRDAFLNEIHQLLDNDPPKNLDPAKGWNLERVPLAVVISLREDYLAHLGDLRKFFPGLRESNLRLVPFSETQARDVIEKPAPWSADPAFTVAALASLRQASREPAATAVPIEAGTNYHRTILSLLLGRRQALREPAATAAAIEAGTNYDPAILSLLLSRLFGSLRQAETGEARARIVRQKGQDVLLDFYRETLAHAGVNKRERGFLEEKLVTHSGLRNSVALEDAEKRYHARRQVLDRLREARLLHFDERALGHQRVELAHDVLCGVVLRARDGRRAVLRRTLAMITGVALIIMGLAGYVAWKEANAREAREVKLRKESEAREAVLEQVGIADRHITDDRLDEASKALALARQLVNESSSRLDPTERRYQLGALSRSAHSLGSGYRKKGDTRKALEAFQESLRATEEIAAISPNDVEAQISVAYRHSWVGDQFLALGDTGSALQAFRVSNEILGKRAATDPNNTDGQHELALSYARLAGALKAQGDLRGALQAYRTYNDIFQKLAAKERDNTLWQSDLAVSYSLLGAVLEERGDLLGAFEAFRAYNDISQKLVVKEPNNSLWQRELAVSYGRLAGVLEAQGDLPGALQAFRTHNDIIQKLASKEPDNSLWQRDRAIGHSRLGRVLEAQGDLTGALQACRIDLEISQKLAAKDSDNTNWQRELVVSYRGIGDVLVKLNNLPDAIASYRTASERMAPLASRPGGPVLWRWDMGLIHIGLGHALRLAGEPESALPELLEAERKIRAAAEASPDDVDYQGGLGLVSLRLGQILLALNPPQTEQGLGKLKEGRDRLFSLDQNLGLNFYQKQWLAELEQEMAKASPR